MLLPGHKKDTSIPLRFHTNLEYMYTNHKYNVLSVLILTCIFIYFVLFKEEESPNIPELRYYNSSKTFHNWNYKLLNELGVLGRIHFVNLSKPLPPVTLVSAISENHAGEGRSLVVRLAKEHPKWKLYLYDLGMQAKTKEWFEGACNVELRTIDLRHYGIPRDLFTYQWKPIIIATALKEFPIVFWLDSSTFIAPKATFDEFLKNITIAKEGPHVYLLDSTGHSTFAVTKNGMYDYLSPQGDLYREQYQAKKMLFIRTRSSYELVLKWLVLCALETNCMAPSGHKRKCDFGTDREMSLRLLLFALFLTSVLGFEKGFLATKIFPVNKLKAVCKHENHPLYTFPLPCNVSDLLTLFGASHFTSTLQSYMDPALVMEKMEGYTTSEWYRDSLDVYVRTVNYNLTLRSQTPVQIEEIQTVRNYTDDFLFHRFISLTDANSSQIFVIDVLNCGQIKNNAIQLQTSVSSTSYSSNPIGPLLDRLKQEIRESTRDYGHAMTKHCAERKIHIPINYIFLQMKESPAFDDKHIYRNRHQPDVTVEHNGEVVSMESILRQHVYRYLFKENVFARLTAPMPPEERECKQYLGLIGACAIFIILMAIIICPSCCEKKSKDSNQSGLSSPIPVPNSTPTETHCIEESAEKQRDMRDAVAASLVADLTDRIICMEESVQCSETVAVIEMENISKDVHH